MAFHGVLWGWKVDTYLEHCSLFQAYEPKKQCQTELNCLHLMQGALYKAYISYKTTHGPQSLDDGCQEGLKGSESQKAGGELHFVL